MSSLAPAEEIELLERVLLRLGNADSDEKLEAVVGKFLCPVLLKITSPHENVRCKVMEILNHVNKRLKSRSLVQLPLEPLFDQYKMSDSAFLHNFVIIYISMGFKRISLEKQGEMVPKVLSCLPGKPESHKENLILLVVPTLGDVKVPDDPKDRPGILQLDQQTRQMFIGFLQDILLFPYGVTEEAELPPGLCTYSFKRIVAKNWKAEELEQHKRGIVKFVCHGIFTDLESFILLVLASSDTRFSVATPAIAELSKVCTTLDFTDPQITAPLYTLFSGNGSKELDRKTTPCSARVRQKLLQYLIKNRGKGINTVKGIQVIFEGLYGDNTNQKCKVLALQFCENLIKDGPKELLSKVAKVLLSGLAKLIGKDSTEPLDVQNAAYSAMAQLARTCPDVVNEDLKILLSYFNHLTTASPELHSSIREALVAMAPAFAWNYNAMDTEGDTEEKFIMNARQNLLLAMLADSAQSKLQIAQNVTSVFLTTCFPEYFAPARFLLLLIAGERSSLREAIITYLYGVSKKDHINYNMLSSIDHPEEVVDDSNKLSSEQRRVVLPSFKEMTNHTWEMIQKRLNGPAAKIVVGKTELAYTLNVYEEILDYLRICLWFSAGVKAAPGDEKHSAKLRDYVLENYEASENNEIYKYLQLVRTSVEARRDETNLLCLYDLLNAAPDLLTAKQMHLLEPLSLSIRDISEILRGRVAQVYGILLAYGLPDDEFDTKMDETVNIITQTTNPVEMRAGWSLILGHAYSRRIIHMQKTNTPFIPEKWSSFIPSVQVLAYLLVELQFLLVTAAVKGLSLIGKVVEIPEFEIKFSKMEVKDVKIESKDPPLTRAPSKFFIYEALFSLLQSGSTRAKIREDAAICLGYLAIGDGEFFTLRNLHKFLSFAKVLKDPALNIAIAQAIVCTICGYDVNLGPPSEDFVNPHYVESNLEWFLQSLLKIVPDPNPQSRQACSIWLLAVVKHCSNLGPLLAKKQMLQYAFTELLSDDSEFVQDVASRGLGLVFTLSTPNNQQDLANSLIDQLIGGKRDVKKVNEDTEMFPEGYLGKTPTGGNITTYKELCGLASDLNQPEMIYQFLQLANNNAAWNSRVGAAFGLKSIPKDAKIKMQPFLGKIIPRFYRYKYDPTPRIQNSMISIWDSIVTDSKEAVETFYWEILKEILAHLTDYEWRVRIACCLAVRDLLKRPNGLRLRSEEKTKQETGSSMDVDDEVPEPELKELWAQLFRVMDDTHDGTRTAAEGTANTLSKICVIAASSNHGKSGMAVASSILPLLLDVGITHTVPEVRKISIKTISELIESSGALIKPHLSSLIPCLLRATGELEIPKLYLAGGSEVQEAVDSLRAEAAKSHHTMETTAKCVRHIDFESLEQMTPAILDLMKSSISLGSKTACAHFICLVSIRLGKDMTPLVGKYLGACFTGLKDRNATVRKYYASAIGHLIGIAKEQSIKNLLSKLDDYYQENPLNKGIPLTIQSINKRYHDLLKDYMENVLPLIFFAMHEEVNEENKSNVELWKELWIEISPGDAGIRMNLDVIIDKLQKNLEDPSWLRKAQSANAIQTIANRLGTNLEEEKRLKLLNLLLAAVGGRTFEGKEKILQAIASLCKGLNKEDPICESIIDAAMKECRKEEPKYRTHALRAIGDILEELEADRFEEVYDMIWYLLDKKDLQSIMQEDDATNITADERNKRAQIFNKLKEVVCETLGKSWPKNSFETQEKYQIQFAERCAQCLKDNTRQVQVSLLVALGKFLERLKIFNVEDESNKEKKQKVDRDGAISKICNEVLSAVAYVSTLPHTGLRKESLNIILTLIKKLSEREHAKHLAVVKKSFEETLPGFEKDSSPEVRCRIKDIQDKLRKI